MKKDPLVTVMMAVYNGEKYIGQAIESILRQDFKNYELLIVNDASTDETIQIARSYNEPKIRIVNSNRKMGLAKVRQRGVEESSGKFIAFLDCDDIAIPERLSTQLTFIEKHRDISMVGSWVGIIDEDSRLTGKVWKHSSFTDTIPAILLFRNCFSQSSVLIKKDHLIEFPYRSEYWAAPDYDLWIRLAKKIKMTNIPKVLAYYRMHPKSMSVKNKNDIDDCINKIFANNLKEFGINASIEEIKVHRFLEPCYLDYPMEMIVKIANWLMQLIEANTKHSRFPEDIFNRLVSDYWFKVCCATASLGYPVLKSYYNVSNKILPKPNSIKKNLILPLLCSFKKSLLIDITSDLWIKFNFLS